MADPTLVSLPGLMFESAFNAFLMKWQFWLILALIGLATTIIEIKKKNKKYSLMKKSTGPILNKEVCPKCGAELIKKIGKHGYSDFYACPNYPKCKFIKKM